MGNVLHVIWNFQMKIVCNINNREIITLQLKKGECVFDELTLTISQGFDTLLITAIDKLLTRNRIDKLSLNTFKISDKIRSETISGMLIKTIKTVLEI